MTDIPRPSKANLVEAVRDGVRQAFEAALRNRDVIKEGITIGIGEDSKEAIKEGTKEAFDQVYGSEILGAIADGTREAMERLRREDERIREAR
jgi:hypothetical protein